MMALGARGFRGRAVPWIGIGIFTWFSMGLTCGPSGPNLPGESVTCSDAGAMDPALVADPAKPAIDLGTTDDAGGFQRVMPGQALSHIDGPQGGSHVWAAVRLYAPVGGDWRLDFALTQGATKVGVGTSYMFACAGAVAELNYVRVFLQGSAPFDATLSVDANPAGWGSGPTSSGSSSGAGGSGSSEMGRLHIEIPVRIE